MSQLSLRNLIYTFDHPIFIMLRHWLDARSPIFRIIAMRPIPVPSLEGTWVTSKRVRKLLQLMTDWSSAAGCLLMPLFFVVPFAPWLWRIPTLISTGPLIAGEIEGRTWFSLRSTPQSAREIISAIHAAGAYRVAFMWAYVTGMRAAVVGILAMIMVILSWSPGKNKFYIDVLGWLAYLSCAFYFVFEPLLDVAIDGMVALLGSTFSRGKLGGVLNATLLRLALWGIQAMSLIVLVPLAYDMLSVHQAATVPNLVLLGPAYALTLDYSSEAALVMVWGVVIARLIWLSVLTTLTAWRAEIIRE